MPGSGTIGFAPDCALARAPKTLTKIVDRRMIIRFLNGILKFEDAKAKINCGIAVFVFPIAAAMTL